MSPRKTSPNKTSPSKLAVLLALIVLGSTAIGGRAQPAPDAAFKVGVLNRPLLPAEPYDWRGAGSHALPEVVWYPADTGAEPKPQRIPPVGTALFEAAPAAANAKLAPSPDKFPLILLSHGTGGTAQSIAWFATALAARGYIVAGVNHPGNNAIDTYTVQGFTLWWKRAQDLSVVLDDMLADPQFGPRIDRSRIAAAGFSLGGYTVIELAGGITELQRFMAACKAANEPASCQGPPEFPDLVAKAQALAKADPAYAKALATSSKSYRDARIRAIFAMAPAVGGAVTPESLGAIAIPVSIVDGVADSITPIEANAKYYATKIPHMELTIFPGGVEHYTFLDVCTDAGRAALPQLCIDRPGVDRQALHDATIEIAAKFFAGQLRGR
jgi:predicted dienelactone hydrolase